MTLVNFASTAIKAALQACGCCGGLPSSSSAASSSSSSSSSSGSGIQTACCEDPVPTSLTATLTDLVDCTGFTGQTVGLTYNSGTEKWEGETDLCGETYAFAFYCDGVQFRLDMTSPNCEDVANLTAKSSSCDPFEFVFNVAQNAACGCCNAASSFDVTVTL